MTVFSFPLGGRVTSGGLTVCGRRPFYSVSGQALHDALWHQIHFIVLPGAVTAQRLNLHSAMAKSKFLSKMERPQKQHPKNISTEGDCKPLLFKADWRFSVGETKAPRRGMTHPKPPSEAASTIQPSASQRQGPGPQTRDRAEEKRKVPRNTSQITSKIPRWSRLRGRQEHGKGQRDKTFAAAHVRHVAAGSLADPEATPTFCTQPRSLHLHPVLRKTGVRVTGLW